MSDANNFEEIFGGVEIVRGPLKLKKPLRPLEEEEDDGLTEAQRAAERAKEKRLVEDAVKGVSYKEKIQQFNEKLAKLTDHNEMPRISGQ